MKKLRNTFGTMALVGVALVGLYSCSEDKENLPPSDERLSQEELRTIISADEIGGIADDAIAELYNNKSSVGKSMTAIPEQCYTAEYSPTGFVATFNNCPLNGTDSVHGTVTVAYATDEETTTFTATFVDFYVGDIKINGTRSYTLHGNSDQNIGSFTVGSDLSAELEDGSSFSEHGTKTYIISFDDQSEDLILTISGEWTVSMGGNTYHVKTLDTVAGNSSCGYPTTGKVAITKNGLEVIVDFGNGKCDDKVTVAYPNGATEQMTM